MSNIDKAGETNPSGQASDGEVSTEALESVSGGMSGDVTILHPIIGRPVGPIVPGPILPIEPIRPIDTIVEL
ncbi:MAG: hypothetical protein ACREND_15980 [Gemmatimonadaceae bacterium]